MADRDVIIILDRSGSMQVGQADHEGGLRSFVNDLRALAGDVRLTFVRFDTKDPCEIVFTRKPVADVVLTDLTLVPRSGTPLLDAMGFALTQLRAGCGQQVVCMIITDGEENSSRKWTKEQVKTLVAELETQGWSFLYLGANVDAFAEAGSVGVAAASASVYVASPAGIGNMYGATVSNLASTYAAVDQGETWGTATKNLTFTSAQRQAMLEGDTPLATGGITKKNEKGEETA